MSPYEGEMVGCGDRINDWCGCDRSVAMVNIRVKVTERVLDERREILHVLPVLNQ
jgi:hypothetical protein